MAASVTPTLAVLRELIKKEARVKGSDNLDPFIDGIVNELLCNFAGKNLYFELLKVNQVVSTTLNNGIYAIPNNFIRMRQLRYKRASGYTYTIRPRTDYIKTARGARPTYYDLFGASIEIFPFDDIPLNDTLLLDYWAYPDTMVDATVFPIPRLVTPVKLEAIRRVLIYNEQLQAAQVIKGEAVENEVRSRKP